MHALELVEPNRASPSTCVLNLIALSSWEDENDNVMRCMYSSALRACPRSQYVRELNEVEYHNSWNSKLAISIAKQLAPDLSFGSTPPPSKIGPGG